MRQCTWRDCKEEGKFEQKNERGEVWAFLCEEHHKELDDSCGDKFSPKASLRAWIRANGGARELAKKMTGDFKK